MNNENFEPTYQQMKAFCNSYRYESPRGCLDCPFSTYDIFGSRVACKIMKVKPDTVKRHILAFLNDKN